MAVQDKTVVRVADVSKKFVIHLDKSIKERILGFTRRNQSRSEFWALHNVRLDIAAGETVGLVGHNGSGKSTLLKVIGGILAPSSGTLSRRGRVAALLELGAGFHPDLTGRENVYLNAAILGMSSKETDRVFVDIVEFAGIGEFIDSQVKFYSSGMYVRLAFAVAVFSDPDILLVDEVLAVGDEPFQAKCLAKIRQFQEEGRTIVFVSHSAEQVADICTRVVVLDAGVVVHDGDVGEGIRVLRRGYAREAEQVAADGSTADSRGGNGAHIESIRLLDLDDEEFAGRVIERGTDVTVEIKISIEKKVDWVAGFTLSTPAGQPIYRLNTDGLGIALPQEPGDYRIKFAIPSTNFGSKRLVLSAGALSRGGEILHVLDPAGYLDYADDEHGAGVAQFDVSGSVERTDVHAQG